MACSRATQEQLPRSKYLPLQEVSVFRDKSLNQNIFTVSPAWECGVESSGTRRGKRDPLRAIANSYGSTDSV
jgi:hypothetical protein